VKIKMSFSTKCRVSFQSIVCLDTYLLDSSINCATYGLIAQMLHTSKNCTIAHF